jgi:hypothetical protein
VEPRLRAVAGQLEGLRPEVGEVSGELDGRLPSPVEVSAGDERLPPTSLPAGGTTDGDAPLAPFSDACPPDNDELTRGPAQQHRRSRGRYRVVHGDVYIRQRASPTTTSTSAAQAMEQLESPLPAAAVVLDRRPARPGSGPARPQPGEDLAGATASDVGAGAAGAPVDARAGQVSGWGHRGRLPRASTGRSGRVGPFSRPSARATVLPCVAL